MPTRHDGPTMPPMSQKPYPSQTQDRYIVRFPEGMRDQIAEAAKANNRSMNAEIVARLEATFDGSLLTIPQAQDLASKVAEQVTDQVIARIIDPLDEPTFANVLQAIRATPRPKPQIEGAVTKRIAQRPKPKPAT